MQYNPVTPQIIQALQNISGLDAVFSKEDEIQSYSHDYTENLKYSPEVVVRPSTAFEVSAILKICNENKIPVTPAGARTGLSGGALPIFGGVVLGLERMNKIIEIDTRNLQATVEPGVITEAFQNAVAAEGLFYPVDPASRGSCFIGGNLATSSGGMRAVKYGITKDYVLGLEVVLPDGEIIHTGARTLKNSTGYNLTQLMVGSEGTLGIITQATFKLVAPPQFRMLLLAGFARGEKACEAVSAIFHSQVLPSAIEFVEREAIEISQKFLGHTELNTDGIEAFLIIELDGNHRSILEAESERVFEVMNKYEVGEVLVMDTEAEMNRIWKIRRAIGEATRSQHLVREEDTVVPRAELPKLWKKVKMLSAAAGFSSYCFGHAGDGNLHIHLIKPPDADEKVEKKLKEVVTEIFKFTISLGGTLSGEHGIGLVQKEYMHLKFSKTELSILKGIKELFDPNGIMNPGKMLPDQEF